MGFEYDPLQTQNYGVLSMMLFLSGHADTPEDATAIAREFFAADIPVTGDRDRDVELEMFWLKRRLTEGRS